MTKLSLFLYGADALDSIDSIFIGVGVVSCVIAITAHELSTEMKAVLHDITGIIHSYAVDHGAKEAK